LSKDQLIGAGILAVCVILAVAFVVLQVFPVPVANLLGMTVDSNTGINIRLNSVLILVSIAFVAVLAIGSWIGFTMATTPPPKPIEEITSDISEEKSTNSINEPKTTPT
jgi:hypothetical protein